MVKLHEQIRFMINSKLTEAIVNQATYTKAKGKGFKIKKGTASDEDLIYQVQRGVYFTYLGPEDLLVLTISSGALHKYWVVVKGGAISIVLDKLGQVSAQAVDFASKIRSIDIAKLKQWTQSIGGRLTDKNPFWDL